MKLYVDLDTREVRASAFGSSIDTVYLTRNGTEDFEVRFVQSGSVVEPSGSFDVLLCIKSWGKYDEDPPLLLGGPLTKSGSGASAVWSGSFVVSAAEIDAELNLGDADDENDVRALPAMLEIVRSYSSGLVLRPSRKVQVDILPNVYQGSESAPAVIVAARLLHLPGVVGLTGGGSTNLDGQTTASLGSGAIVLLSYDDISQLWKLRSKAVGEVEDGAAFVTPDDSSTLIWVRIG